MKKKLFSDRYLEILGDSHFRVSISYDNLMSQVIIKQAGMIDGRRKLMFISRFIRNFFLGKYTIRVTYLWLMLNGQQGEHMMNGLI